MKKRGPGRPPIAKGLRHKNAISVRLRDDAFKRLTKRAEQSGRSISQQAEIHIEADLMKSVPAYVLMLAAETLNYFLDALDVVTTKDDDLRQQRLEGMRYSIQNQIKEWRDGL